MAKNDIVFVNGLVRSKEKQLIPESKFLQAADAENADEALRLLKDLGYPVGEFSADEYEKIVAADWNEFEGFLKKYAPDDRFYLGVTAEYDFFNAESAVRKKHLGLGAEVYSFEGSVPIAKLEEAAAGNYAAVPAYIAKPMKETEKLFSDGTATGVKVSTLFLRAYYAYMLKNAEGKDWRENVACEIDAKNLSVAFRAKDMKSAREMFIAGGKLKEDVSELIISGEDKKALDKLLRTPYYDLAYTGIKERAEGGPLVAFEKQADDFAMKKLKEKRFESEGVTPFLLYANYKKNEIANVRIVLAMKNCGADKESIRRRLREGYGG
ncbi:MAG: V-type ATPase subunit [Clostridia bacterium]|nr:V-type ATPase subunit [Clostridia bacterium]